MSLRNDRLADVTDKLLINNFLKSPVLFDKFFWDLVGGPVQGASYMQAEQIASSRFAGARPEITAQVMKSSQLTWHRLIFGDFCYGACFGKWIPQLTSQKIVRFVKSRGFLWYGRILSKRIT